jgi:CHAD domain-containing protein
LEYFFLRFPGTLGPEEPWSLEFFDTYDGRWAAQGLVWMKKDETMTLVAPPSLVPVAAFGPDAFGLQAPVKTGRATVKVRSLAFSAAGASVTGQVVRARSHTYLVLQQAHGAFWNSLTAALADAWEPWQSQTPLETLFVPKDTGFKPPSSWPPVLGSDSGTKFLVERLGDEWRLARQYEKGIRDDVDTECLHQYRVHLRRARSLVSVGRQWETQPEWLRLKTVLGELQRQTNELRDLDVLILDLPSLMALLPGEGKNLQPWDDALRTRRRAEWRRVKAWLESEPYEFSCAEVAALASDLLGLGEPWTLGHLAASAFQKAGGGLRKALKAVGPQAPDELLHELRIRAKKLRYTLDSFGVLGPPAAVKTLLAVLKQSQDGLGAFQDRSNLVARLGTERDALGRGRSQLEPVAFGMLLGYLIADHRVQREAALHDSRTLESRRFRSALERLIASGNTDEL